MFGETLNRCFGWMLPPSKKSLAMEMKEVSDSCRESLTSGRVNMLLDEIKSAAQNGAVVFYIKPALAEFYYRPEIIQVLYKLYLLSAAERADLKRKVLANGTTTV
jgi:hypothetical protein